MFFILDAMESSNLGDDKGLQMALGNLDINTMERIDNFSPDKPLPQVPDQSILIISLTKCVMGFDLKQLCKCLFLAF